MFIPGGRCQQSPARLAPALLVLMFLGTGRGFVPGLTQRVMDDIGAFRTPRKSLLEERDIQTQSMATDQGRSRRKRTRVSDTSASSVAQQQRAGTEVAEAGSDKICGVSEDAMSTGGRGRRAAARDSKRGHQNVGSEVVNGSDHGETAKREGFLFRMRIPKTRRQGLVDLWESELDLMPNEYAALLTAACQLGWAAMASAIMEEMTADGVPVDAKTYALAVKAACRADDVRLALLLIMDQYARWKGGDLSGISDAAVRGVGDDREEDVRRLANADIAGGGKGTEPKTRAGIRLSDIKQHFPKVLAVTTRTGDMAGSLETLKYMSVMGVEMTSGMCQNLITTAFKAGGENVMRVPGILRAMGDVDMTPEMSLLETLTMLYEAQSPEAALDLLLEVARGDGKAGLSSFYQPQQVGPEAFAVLIEQSEKMGRLDVIGDAIHALMVDIPGALHASVRLEHAMPDGALHIVGEESAGARAGNCGLALLEEDREHDASVHKAGYNSTRSTGETRANGARSWGISTNQAVVKDERYRELKAAPPKVVVTLNAMLLVLAKQGSGHAAAALLEQWRATTLGGQQARDEDEATQAEQLMIRFGKPNESSYSLTMAALVRSGQWGRARSLLEVMRVDGVPPSTACYSNLLTFLLNRVEPRTRDGATMETHDGAHIWAEPTYEWEEVVSLIQDAREAKGVEVTSGMYESAFVVLQHIAPRPDWSSLGMGYAGPAPPAEIFVDKAEDLLQFARADDINMTPDILFPAVLLAYRAQDAPRVFQYVEDMLALEGPHKKNLQTYAEAYSMALDACAFGGDPERALAYVHNMRLRSGFRPVAAHYERAVKAMATASRYRDAYQVLAEAVEAGAASAEVYDAAIKAAALEGNAAQAETIMRVMVDMGLKPGTDTMSQLILAYGACGDIGGLCSVMARATSRAFPGSALNALVYESLLRVLLPLEAWREAEAFVKEAERILPGSLTYRTYGYLMAAYAAEEQWGAALDFAKGIGRWPEKSSEPGSRFHPPELRETTCVVALEWLLTRGMSGGTVARAGAGDQEESLAVQRALTHRRRGRELFTRLLAAGGPLQSTRVIEAALAGAGAGMPSASMASLHSGQGADYAPLERKNTVATWANAERSTYNDRMGMSEPDSISPSGELGLPGDWLASMLPREEAEREAAAQALHVSTVVEVLLRTYATCEQPSASEFYSPTAVGLVQQGISAACVADDPDLAERLLEAWLARARISKSWNTRVEDDLRVSLSEVLTAFLVEEGGKEGVFRGLALISRCRDAGLEPYPHDSLSAMRACNSAGLFTLSLGLFDELSQDGPHAEPDMEQGFTSESAGAANNAKSSQVRTAGKAGSSSGSSTVKDDGINKGNENESKGSLNAGTRRKRQARAGSRSRSKVPMADVDDPVGPRRSGGGGDAAAAYGRRFGDLHAVPDSEMIPAAAATIALESCFLGGARDRATEIVWQLIRRRHPLTEACRNRAIVALTEGGQPDMALDMARGMEVDDHYVDAATLEFVERFQERAFQAAEACDVASADGKGSARSRPNIEEGVARTDALAAGKATGNEAHPVAGHVKEHEETEGGQRTKRGCDHETTPLGATGVDRCQDGDARCADGGEGSIREPPRPGRNGAGRGDEQAPNGGVSAVSPVQYHEGFPEAPPGSPPGAGDGRPAELVLRFLPLLVEALRNRLRAEGSG